MSFRRPYGAGVAASESKQGGTVAGKRETTHACKAVPLRVRRIGMIKDREAERYPQLLARCMGGRFCNHAIGTCTATNGEYQRRAKAKLAARGEEWPING